MTGPWRHPPRRVNRRLRRAALVLPYALLAVLAVAGVAWAEDTTVIGAHPLHTPENATHIKLHAPTHPQAAATLTYVNRGVNGPADNGDYAVTWQGLTVVARYTWNARAMQADRIEVIPPPGYIAVPDTLALDEETSGEIHLMKYEGM